MPRVRQGQNHERQKKKSRGGSSVKGGRIGGGMFLIEGWKEKTSMQKGSNQFGGLKRQAG